ncbi:MAG: DMT family transporter [Pseudomonadota bacterium]
MGQSMGQSMGQGAGQGVGQGVGTPARGLAAFYDTPWLLLVVTALFWGGNAIAGQLARDAIQPLFLVIMRWAVVAGVLWALFGHEVRAHWHIARPRMLQIVLIATTGFTGFNALFYMASLSTTAVNVGILQGSMPVFVLLGAVVLMGERVATVQAIGVVLTLGGVVLVATGGDPAAVLAEGLNPGDGLMLIACVMYSAYTLALRARPAMPGRAFFTLMAVIATLTAVPFWLAEVALAGFEAPSVQGYLVAAYVAIFPSCLAQLFFLRGVDLIGPAKAGVYINLVPVFAALLAVALLGEPFRWYHAAAMGLVLGGIWLAQRPSRAAG